MSWAADLPAWEEAALEFSVNSQHLDTTLLVLRDPGGSLWLEEADFAKLRLHVPASTPRMHGGQRYYPLAAVPGIDVRVDEPRQTVALQVPPGAFELARLNTPGPSERPLTQATPGAFLDYQGSAQHTPGGEMYGVFTRLGLFGGWGVLTNTTAMSAADETARITRLETTYTRDFPDRLETLTLGDAISDPGSWGDAVRFAGLHWGSHLGIRPDLITTPMLSASGVAIVPSTVDVLVNNQRVSTQQVSPGPFVINNLPPLSGAGDVTVVVRDALGRDQVITRSFYSSARLLARGLNEYAIDVGSIRNDYARVSDRYGSPMAAATYRRGIDDGLTLEGHAEFLEHEAHAAGLNAVVGMGSFGSASLVLADGGTASGTGWLRGVTVERHSAVLSLTASTLFATAGYHQLADTVLTGERFRRQSLVQVGLSLRRAGLLSVAYLEQSYPTAPQQRTVSLTHSLNLGLLGALGLTITRGIGSNTSTGAFLTFTRGLRSRSSWGVGTQGGTGAGAPPSSVITTLSQNPPIGPGTGYRLSASTTADYDADLRGQFTAGSLEFEAARSGGLVGQRALAEGALLWLDGDGYAARTVPESFAVVDVGAIQGIPVYVDNQMVTRTDPNGRALLPNLISYAPNRISIDPADLPLDTAIEARSITVAPAFSSGVVVRFPVERVRAGIFRLVTEDGQPVPSGATVQLNGAVFPVALDGMVYVTGFDHGMGAFAKWPGGQCRFRLKPPPPDDPLPDMGTITCKPYSPAAPQTARIP